MKFLPKQKILHILFLLVTFNSFNDNWKAYFLSLSSYIIHENLMYACKFRQKICTLKNNDLIKFSAKIKFKQIFFQLNFSNLLHVYKLACVHRKLNSSNIKVGHRVSAVYGFLLNFIYWKHLFSVPLWEVYLL